MHALNPLMIEAFLATEYLVNRNGTLIPIRIGHHPQWSDDDLDMACWCILTPCNPGAQRLSTADNQVRFDRLRWRIESDGLRWLPCCNRDPGGNWPDEPGCLIVAPGASWLRRQMQDFGQLGVVYGRPGEPAELWLRAQPPPMPAHPHLRWIGQ